LRYAPFPRRCSGTFYQPWSLLRKALIRAGKTSYTAGTLCAIFFAPHLSTRRALLGAGNLLFYLELTKQEYFEEYIKITFI
jgi:hypothetical protein